MVATLEDYSINTGLLESPYCSNFYQRFGLKFEQYEILNNLF